MNANKALRGLELTALSTTVLAFILTVAATSTGRFVEANGAVRVAVEHVGWTGTGLLAVGFYGSAFAFYRRLSFDRVALAAGVLVVLPSLVDLGRNLLLLSRVGLPVPGAIFGTVAPVVVGALLVSAHPYRDAIARGVDRVRPVAQRTAPAVVAVLMVTSVFAGVVVLGTQPIADGQSGTASAAAGDEVWNASAGSAIYSSPTIANGIAYVGSDDGSLYAFDVDTGDELWNSSTGGGIYQSSPTVSNGTVYIGSRDNSLTAFDAETGEKQWSKSTGGKIDSSPTVWNGVVYVGSSDNSLYAFDAETGEQQWSQSTGGSVRSAPTIANGTVYVGSHDSSLYAFDAETGQQQWSKSTGGEISSSPTVWNGTVYVGSDDFSVYAFDAETGQQQWSKSPADGYVESSPTVANGTVFVGYASGSIYAFDARDGQQQWSYATGRVVESSPTVADGTVYVHHDGNSLFALDAETGNEVWIASTNGGGGDSSPIVADGTVFIGTGNGYIHAFDTAHSKDSSGSRNRLHTLGHVGAVGASASTAADINGTVVNQNGQPVPNATVTVNGIDRSQLSVNPSELDARAQEILNELENPTPPNFSTDRTLTGGDGLFSNANTDYVAVHEKADWGLTAWSDEPQLGNPSVQLPADEEIALSVWDPTSTGLLQDGVNGDLPGRVVDDTDIVVESIDHAGGTVDTRTIETDTTYEVGGVVGGSHDLATTTLPAGFYRVYPEGSPETGYVIVVGDPSQIANTIRTDLKNEANQLTEQAKNARDYMNRDVLKQYTATTNENGSFSVDVPDSVTRVSVQAHKAPPGLSQDPQNASLQDVREFYAVTDYNGSYVMPADAGTYSVPANDITVDVVETEAPQFANLTRFQNATERFQALLQNLSYSELPASLQQRLGGVDRERLEETARELQQLRNQNSELESRVQELMDRDLSEIDINTSSDAALREQIRAQEQAIAELRATIEASETSAEVADGVAQSSATFGQALTEEQLRVVANFPNGTSKEVPSKYVTLDQSAATIVGEGGTDVTVEDYPLGNADSVTFDYVVVTESGIGETSTNAQDPNAKTIGLDAISLSSLRPGPDEQVDVTLIGDDDTQIANITNVRAVAPDGSELTTSSEGKTATFTTDGDGRHYVEVTFNTASGEQGTLTHRIAAGPTDQAMPPGIRLKDTPFGTLAVVGDGFDAGSVDVSNGGTQIDILAQIGADADTPARMHVYAHSADLPPAATMSISVVRGENQRAVQRHIEVTTHLPTITSDNAVLYRGEDALPRSGEGQIASVTTASDETTIVTVTDASGSLELQTNNNPGPIERLFWSLDRNAPDISVPFVGQIPTLPTIPIDVSGAVGWVGPQAAPTPTIDTAVPA